MRVIAFVLLGVVLAACSITVAPTGDTAGDVEAAPSFLPDLTGAGYSAQNADNIQEAFTNVGAGGGLLTGNPATSALVVAVDQIIDCYQDVGAIAANIYTENLGTILEGEIPGFGALAVVNETRLGDNLLQCTIGQVADEFSAQAATIEPCTGSGRFTYTNGDAISYVYASSTPELCDLFVAHFAQYDIN